MRGRLVRSSKTTVKVKLYRERVDDVSSSQARRMVSGLEKFKVIESDFETLPTIGQGFADEIFRVWQAKHPDIRIVPINAGPNVLFMIRFAAPRLQLVYDSKSRIQIRAVNPLS
jgi:hypothetical protein